MKSRLIPLLAFALLSLGSCSMRTVSNSSTVFDVRFSMVSAGNIPLTEWQIVPPGYENYYGSYIKTYTYRLYHDNSVEFAATYGFDDNSESKSYSEKETGTYHATNMGPRQRIDISLPGRTARLTWEPNPRDPTGNLVFRLWENRVMDFGYVDDDHPAQQNVNAYVVLLSQSISPHPL